MGDLQVRSVPTHAHVTTRPAAAPSSEVPVPTTTTPRATVTRQASGPVADANIGVRRVFQPAFEIRDDRPDRPESVQDVLEAYREQTGVRKGGFGPEPDSVTFTAQTEAGGADGSTEEPADALELPETNPTALPIIRGIRKGGKWAVNFGPMHPHSHWNHQHGR